MATEAEEPLTLPVFVSPKWKNEIELADSGVRVSSGKFVSMLVIDQPCSSCR